jgi:prophage DNA circulation protein
VSDWTDQLLPASWRGIEFKVLSTNDQFGRRVALHQYAFRDKPWSEDIGRAARRPAFQAYLLGDDALSRMRALVAAAEQSGPGTLVHPSFGVMDVTLLEPMTVTQRWDGQRLVELEFRFIEAGAQEFPTTIVATGSAITSLAARSDAATSSDFLAEIGSALKTGSVVVGEAVSVVNDWAGRVNRLVGDATALTHAVGSLTGGNFGRYFSGSRALASLSAPVVTLNRLIGIGSAARQTVRAATTDLQDIASGLGI